MSRRQFILTPDLLLRAYAAGIFPMAESAESRELKWFDPPIRAIIPLDHQFHVPKRLARTIRQRPYEIRLNSAFEAIMRACAAPAADRPSTWINEEIIRLYTELHKRGHAHSIEVWQDEKLVGGLYGVSLGAAFFGESMFSRAADASKIALVYLVYLLRLNNYSLLDTQFQTDHLQQFGTLEITRDHYQHLLAVALQEPHQMMAPTGLAWHQGVAASLQPITQTS